MNLTNIIEKVNAYYGVDVRTEGRKKPLPQAKGIYCWYAYRHTNTSMALIGKAINRDHTTAVYHVGRVEELIHLQDTQTLNDIHEVFGLDLSVRNPVIREKTAISRFSKLLSEVPVDRYDDLEAMITAAVKAYKMKHGNDVTKIYTANAITID